MFSIIVSLFYKQAPGYWGNGKPVFDSSVPFTIVSSKEKGNPIPNLSASNFAISLAPKQYGEKLISFSK